MLEIKNLVKVYKTKGGNEVRAVDNVSVSFAERGMIFLLGKSGSGKSTLLNLCGGLDSPDSGEIIIKGKSSKDFTQSDFDSYRNTFVGFVFQEYNILDEFSVEDNIALALELQGKSKDKKEVAKLLEQVDLTNFAKRKPNTLSGGQKQRVAIARALVKNPEIILADEPTGALDSNTGKQVFDTLKKLSEEKLVVVVSHDREFAELYGDRIIELKDGKIISDVVKTKIQAKTESENVSFIGDNTVSLKDGAALTDGDWSRIREFLSSKSGNVIIAGGEKEVSAYKKAARIDDNNAKESFRDTQADDVEKKAYTAADSKLIRSKLPIRHAARIGASGLKVKPFRLFLTILLTLVAFVMFGLFSTLTFYDSATVAENALASSGYQYFFLRNNYKYTTIYYEYGSETNRYDSSNYTQFTPSDLAAAKEKYGSAYGAFNYMNDSYWSGATFSISNVRSTSSQYYNTSFSMFVETDGNSSDFEILTSGTDLSALGESDVVISSYLFDSIANAGLTTGGMLNSYDDIVGKVLEVRSQMGSESAKLTVKGVYRLDPPAKYQTILDGAEDQNSSLSQSFYAETGNGLYSAMLVSKGFYKANIYKFGSSSISSIFQYLNDSPLIADENALESSSTIINTYIYMIANAEKFKPDASSVYYFDASGEASFGDDGVIVPFLSFSSNLYSYFYEKANDAYNEAYNKFQEDAIVAYKEAHATECETYYNQIYQNYIDLGYSPESAETSALSELNNFVWNGITNENPDFWTDNYNAADKASSDIMEAYEYNYNILYSGQKNVNENSFTATQEDIDAAIAYFIENYFDSFDFSKVVIFDNDGNVISEPMTVVGFTYGAFHYNYSNGFIVNSSVYDMLYENFIKPYQSDSSDPNSEYYYEEITNYEKPEDAVYNFIMLPYNDDLPLKEIAASAGVVNEENSTFYDIYSPIAESLNFVDSLLSSLEKVFLWTGVAMAAFSMLLLFNFISVSISNKKKEIGILRAVGARSTDVFKIFYSESAIITIICFVLSLVACLVLCPLLNSQIAGTLGAEIFIFGPYSILIMLGIAVFTSVIATFLPVYSIARKKPVESIRAL